MQTVGGSLPLLRGPRATRYPSKRPFASRCLGAWVQMGAYRGWCKVPKAMPCAPHGAYRGCSAPKATPHAPHTLSPSTAAAPPASCPPGPAACSTRRPASPWGLQRDRGERGGVLATTLLRGCAGSPPGPLCAHLSRGWCGSWPRSTRSSGRVPSAAGSASGRGTGSRKAARSTAPCRPGQRCR